MVVGMLLTGVVAGIAGVIWSLIAGQGILMALLAYPAVGILGALVFLGFAMSRGLAVSQHRELLQVAETN